MQGSYVWFFCVLSAIGPVEFLSGPAAGSGVTLTSSSTLSSMDILSNVKAQNSIHIVSSNYNRVMFLKGKYYEILQKLSFYFFVPLYKLL